MQPDDTAPENESAPPEAKAPSPLRSAGALQSDKVVEAVLEHFRDKEKREEFYAFFKELQNIYEILSPDAFLRPNASVCSRKSSRSAP